MSNTNSFANGFAPQTRDRVQAMHRYAGPKARGWRRAYPTGMGSHPRDEDPDPISESALCREMRVCGVRENVVHAFLAGPANLFLFWKQEGFLQVPSDLWPLYLRWMHPHDSQEDCSRCHSDVETLLDFLHKWKEGSLPPGFRPHMTVDNYAHGGEVDNTVIQKMIRWLKDSG